MKLHIEQIPDEVKPFPVYPWQKIKNIKAVDVDPVVDLPEGVNIPPLWFWRLVKTCLQEDGIGLAAPQVGVYAKVMVCRDINESGDPYFVLPTFQLYINPSFKPIADEGKTKDRERCLSVPNKAFEIIRWNSIETTWFELSEKRTLEKKSRIISNFPARLFQHEFDHLNGISIPQRYDLQNKPKKKKRKRK